MQSDAFGKQERRRRATGCGGAGAAFAAAALLLACRAGAEPWLPPGDLLVRHDIAMLADAGVIRGPVTTWPLSWGDIARDVGAAQAGRLDPATRASLFRLQRRIEHETRARERVAHVRAAGASDPRTLRTFERTPRESGEIEAGVRWTGLRFSYRLQAIYASDPEDGRDVRADGSYVGFAAANWMFAAGAMDRWWGPGWEGSLILSNNARPIPAVSINRNVSDPVELRFFRWVGPWSASIVMGQLERDRDVDRALFFGGRFTFRPLPSLEIGINRTAQWCGDDRPCDLETFGNLLVGNDNRGVSITREREPGNQLAGLDARWTGGPHGRRYAIYGQMIGEDEAGGTPSKYIGMVGAEYWGSSAWLDGTWRVHLELADTAVDFLGDSQFNVAYEHNIYTDGYRYRGRAIGHPMDNDGTSISVGATLTREDATLWKALVQVGDLNRDGRSKAPHTVSPEGAELINVEVGHERPLWRGLLDAGAGVEWREERSEDGGDTRFELYAQWHMDF